MALLPRQQRNGKGGERKRPAAAAVYSSALKVRTAIISFACSRSRMSWSTPKIDVPALVVQLPHGEAGYVAAEMLQDNLHSVRVALCRCQNDRMGTRAFFRVAGLLPFVPFISIFLQIFFLAAQKSLSACTVSCFSTYRTAPQSRCRSFPRNSTGVRLCAFLPAKYGLLQEAASA